MSAKRWRFDDLTLPIHGVEIFFLFSVDHDHLEHLPRQVVKEDFGFIGQPQKRGAVQPLGLSASSVTITKKPRKTAETKSDAKHKWIAQQQQVR